MATDKKKNYNVEAMVKWSRERWEEIDKYRKIAENAKKGIRYGQEYAAILKENLIEYIKEQGENRQPLTVAGLIKASGFSSDTYYRCRNGEADYKLFKYMEDHNIEPDLYGAEIVGQDGAAVLLLPMSEIIKNAELVLQESLERNCYTNKGNPAGSIFGLKARFGWQDTPAENKTTNNNTLVLNNIATRDEAKEAIKRLTE